MELIFRQEIRAESLEQAHKRHHLHPFVLVSSWLLKGSWEGLTDHGVVLSVNVKVAYFVEVPQ